MDQQKVGRFLKGLRKEKNITQEQFAELMGVSNRSVSRWETGTNMPDLDMLIQIADYYGVEIREILDGEREKEHMDKKMEDTVLKVADYSSNEKINFSKRIGYLFVAGLIAMLVYLFMEIQGLAQSYEGIASFMLGVIVGVLILGIIYTSRYMAKIRAFKMRILNRNRSNEIKGKL